MTTYDQIISVTELNSAIKGVLEDSHAFSYLHVKGEVSNFKIASTGMAFFKLKDDECSIDCVMFSNYLNTVNFPLKNGDSVIANGSIGVYKARGTYNFKVFHLEKEGAGDALLKLEALKKKLFKEGFFDESRKKPINRYPKLIGVITAEHSAAERDILINLTRRYPLCDIMFFPSLVQGEEAPKSLIKAFKLSLKYPLDTLIIGRGGGSSEDLSAFNDEALIRELATCPCPIISAVGHEIDVTLIDLLADKRASTPTGACELATVDVDDILIKLGSYSLSMKENLFERLNTQNNQIRAYKTTLDRSIRQVINNMSLLIEQKSKHLADLNPKSILNRGYSISTDENGNAIKSIKQVKVNSKIKTLLADGYVISNVEDIKDGK